MYYNEQGKLGYTEFSDHFYDQLSHLITNQAHIDQCQDFYEEIIFKLYELYLHSKSESFSVNQCVRVFEVVLFSMFKYNPTTQLPEDLINLA